MECLEDKPRDSRPLHPVLCLLPSRPLLFKIKTMLLFLQGNSVLQQFESIQLKKKNTHTFATPKARTSALFQGPPCFHHLCKGLWGHERKEAGGWGWVGGGLPHEPLFGAERKMKTCTGRSATRPLRILRFAQLYSLGALGGGRELEKDETTVPLVSLQCRTAPPVTKRMLFIEASSFLLSKALAQTHRFNTQGP